MSFCSHTVYAYYSHALSCVKVSQESKKDEVQLQINKSLQHLDNIVNHTFHYSRLIQQVLYCEPLRSKIRITARYRGTVVESKSSASSDKLEMHLDLDLSKK